MLSINYIWAIVTESSRNFLFNNDNTLTELQKEKIGRHFMVLISPLYLLTWIKVYFAQRWLKGGQTRVLFQSYFTISVSFYSTWMFLIIILYISSLDWGSPLLKGLMITSICTSIISWIIIQFHIWFKDEQHFNIAKITRNTVKRLRQESL